MRRRDMWICYRFEEKRGSKIDEIHENYNVVDLDKSMEFYSKALGLKESRRKEAKDGSYIIVYMSNEEADFELELTWLKEWEGNYNLGDCEFHLAFEMIWKQLINFMKKWNAFVLKIKKWEFILLKTLMDIG